MINYKLISTIIIYMWLIILTLFMLYQLGINELVIDSLIIQGDMILQLLGVEY